MRDGLQACGTGGLAAGLGWQKPLEITSQICKIVLTYSRSNPMTWRNNRVPKNGNCIPFDTSKARALRPETLFDLTGKAAIVTGAGGGLGSWLAAGLAAAGASVLATDHPKTSTAASRQDVVARVGHYR